MAIAEVEELIRRLNELETLVRVLIVLVSVLGAVVVTGSVLAAMWLRARHAEVMEGLGGLSREHDGIREEIRTSEVARATAGRALLH